MLLLQLPPEILSLIFCHVGSQYFQKDSSRLTVSKQWLVYGHVELAKELHLSRAKLRRLMSSQHTAHDPLLLAGKLELLSLELTGFDEWSSHDQRNMIWWRSAAGRKMFKEWSCCLGEDLCQLALAAKEKPKLRTLRIQAWAECHPKGYWNHSTSQYLMGDWMRAMLSLERLTHLDLDLCGSIVTSVDEDCNIPHECTMIGAHLTSLTRLRLRLRRICSRALIPQFRHQDQNLRLKYMVVNLSLSNQSPGAIKGFHSSPCDSRHDWRDPTSLQADITARAQALAAQMPSPELVRVLTHSSPSYEIQSLIFSLGNG